jgi:hypothetical protein
MALLLQPRSDKPDASSLHVFPSTVMVSPSLTVTSFAEPGSTRKAATNAAMATTITALVIISALPALNDAQLHQRRRQIRRCPS